MKQGNKTGSQNRSHWGHYSKVVYDNKHQKIAEIQSQERPVDELFSGFFQRVLLWLRTDTNMPGLAVLERTAGNWRRKKRCCLKAKHEWAFIEKI